MRGRRCDGQENEERVTPFAEMAQWVRCGILPYLSPRARIVMLALGSHVNSTGDAWPSAEILAKECGLKRGQIYPALEELEKAGIFTGMGRIKLRNYNVEGPTIYRLNRLDSARTSMFMATTPRWKTGRKGDASRFRKGSDVPNTGTTKRPLDVPFCERSDVSKCEGLDLPVSEPLGVPSCGPLDVPVSGTQRGIERDVKGKRERDFGKGGMGENPFSPSHGKNEGAKIALREGQRQRLEEYFRAQAGNFEPDLSRLTHILTSQGYNLEDIIWACKEAGISNG